MPNTPLLVDGKRQVASTYVCWHVLQANGTTKPVYLIAASDSTTKQPLWMYNPSGGLIDNGDVNPKKPALKETATNAAVRELKEETGLVILPTEVTYFAQVTFPNNTFIFLADRGTVTEKELQIQFNNLNCQDDLKVIALIDGSVPAVLTPSGKFNNYTLTPYSQNGVPFIKTRPGITPPTTITTYENQAPIIERIARLTAAAATSSAREKQASSIIKAYAETGVTIETRGNEAPYVSNIKSTRTGLFSRRISKESSEWIAYLFQVSMGNTLAEKPTAAPGTTLARIMKEQKFDATPAPTPSAGRHL